MQSRPLPYTTQARNLLSTHSLSTTKGMAEVKAAGKYRQEGKSYVVADGDIIHFQVGH